MSKPTTSWIRTRLKKESEKIIRRMKKRREKKPMKRRDRSVFRIKEVSSLEHSTNKRKETYVSEFRLRKYSTTLR